ncbi:MAG TPA: hypothetical protein VGH14_01490 [Solirubrobacterales bacterium]
MLGVAMLITVTVVGIAGAAGGEGPATVRVGEETGLTPAVGFSPKELSKQSFTPIRAFISQELPTFPHPLAERELLIELDRNLMIQTRGLPACHPGVQDGLTIEESCMGTSVGSGEETVQIALPESPPIDVSARLKVLNGGEHDGAITMWLYGFFGEPLKGSLVTKVVFTRHHHGRFGWLADVTLPQIAGGAGSVIQLNLQIGRQYADKGSGASVLSARCTDGELRTHLQTRFEDGSSAEAEVARACTPKV